MEDEYNNIKVVFLGEGYVGKTCLISRYTSGDFDDHNGTTSASYATKKINFKGKDYYFDIWDTSGYESFRSLTKIFINNSKIIVLVYDITQKKSFLELDYWLDTVLKLLGSGVFLILVGNKSDLFLDEEIREEDARKFAKLINAKFILASAKENYLGWNEDFEKALKDYIDNKQL